MVQEEMSMQAVVDSESGADSPELNPCRILSFTEDEPSNGVDIRLSQLIHLLDK